MPPGGMRKTAVGRNGDRGSEMYNSLLIPFIAAATAGIAFLQWRTAHQKVLLDLFERRLKIHEDVNAAILDFLGADGNLVPSKTRVRLHQARLGSCFLFGKEVAEQIDSFSEEVRVIGELRRKINSLHTVPDDQEDIPRVLIDRENELEKWRDGWTAICSPYLRMDQKSIRTPLEWLRSKNVIR